MNYMDLHIWPLFFLTLEYGICILWNELSRNRINYQAMYKILLMNAIVPEEIGMWVFSVHNEFKPMIEDWLIFFSFESMIGWT